MININPDDTPITDCSFHELNSPQGSLISRTFGSRSKEDILILLEEVEKSREAAETENKQLRLKLEKRNDGEKREKTSTNDRMSWLYEFGIGGSSSSSSSVSVGHVGHCEERSKESKDNAYSLQVLRQRANFFQTSLVDEKRKRVSAEQKTAELRARLEAVAASERANKTTERWNKNNMSSNSSRNSSKSNSINSSSVYDAYDSGIGSHRDRDRDGTGTGAGRVDQCGSIHANQGAREGVSVPQRGLSSFYSRPIVVYRDLSVSVSVSDDSNVFPAAEYPASGQDRDQGVSEKTAKTMSVIGGAFSLATADGKEKEKREGERESKLRLQVLALQQEVTRLKEASRRSIATHAVNMSTANRKLEHTKMRCEDEISSSHKHFLVESARVQRQCEAAVHAHTMVMSDHKNALSTSASHWQSKARSLSKELGGILNSQVRPRQEEIDYLSCRLEEAQQERRAFLQGYQWAVQTLTDSDVDAQATYTCGP